MRVETAISSETAASRPQKILTNAGLVFYFLSPDYPRKDAYLGELRQAYPSARLIGCTTGGEIADGGALEGSAVSAAVALERSTARVTETAVSDHADSYAAGKRLALDLAGDTLSLIFVLSDGLKVNGSELVRGITDHAGRNVIVTGGLAGDGANFRQTGVGVDALPEAGKIAAVGFYGESFKVSYGSIGGWKKFGPERIVTRSKGNILYELDGKPALDLYKSYLGDEAAKLPGSGLLFPLSIHPAADSTHDIVRTIVGIDEAAKSLIFAGDIPQGYVAQLMHGNTENLVHGAECAAASAIRDIGKVAAQQSLAILVSCIGRNLLMGQRVSSEVETVQQALPGMPLVGFYSYGEICHHHSTRKCALHNQTMTITLLSEAA